MDIKILLFEDSEAKMESFRELLELKLNHELNSNLDILQRSDDLMLESDLMTNTFHIILIDDDLGNDSWGNEIIDKIVIMTDETPESARVPKIYYSAGTSIDDLKRKISHHGNIPCVTFDNLVDIVFDKIKGRYFN
jgi:hypothetical protein